MFKTPAIDAAKSMRTTNHSVALPVSARTMSTSFIDAVNIRFSIESRLTRWAAVNATGKPNRPMLLMTMSAFSKDAPTLASISAEV